MRILQLSAVVTCTATLFATPAVSGERAALVVGQSAYATAGRSPFSRADARAVADALRIGGWRVMSVYDQTLASLDQALGLFTASLKPGDVALVYYSGLSAKGPAKDPSEGLDNYLLAVDSRPTGPAALGDSAVSLSAVIGALNFAQAGAEIIVLDAARPDLVQAGWSAAFGLAVPTSSSQRNAFVVLPAQPGAIAREGVFAPAFAHALTVSAGSASQLFIDLADQVDRETAGLQNPYYSGSAISSQIDLRTGTPSVQTQTVAERDQNLYRSAIACGSQACLLKASRQVTDPVKQLDLEARSESASSVPVSAAPAPSRSDYVSAYIEANGRFAAGMDAIGRNYAVGADGFPKDSGQTYRWLMLGATAGDPDASYRIGMMFDRGDPPIGHVDKTAAAQFFAKAAQKADPRAEQMLSRYTLVGDGGLPRDSVKSAEWLRKSAADSAKAN